MTDGEQATMQDLIERFVQALEALHRDRSVEPLVDLFTEASELSKLGERHATRGKDGAREFWTTYRGVFDDVEATFTQTVAGDGIAALEWISQGTLASGDDFRYRGVSILEGGQDTVAAFRTYYDSAAFLADRLEP